MRALVLPLLLMLVGCGDVPLAGGYSIEQSATNKEWLKDPEGMMVAPGLIQRLYKGKDSLLLIAFAASTGGEPLPPYPVDQTCLVALLIDTNTGQTMQIAIAKATELAERMERVIVRNRPCV